MTLRITPSRIDVAPELLARIGEGHVAYVREMKSEDFARIFPGGPELPPRRRPLRPLRRRRSADPRRRRA